MPHSHRRGQLDQSALRLSRTSPAVCERVTQVQRRWVPPASGRKSPTRAPPAINSLRHFLLGTGLEIWDT